MHKVTAAHYVSICSVENTRRLLLLTDLYLTIHDEQILIFR